MNASGKGPIKAVNWNRPDDDFSSTFWSQNIMQFWTDEEIPLSDDKMSWMTLDDNERELYMKVLGGLTLLDTVQGGVGMPKIMEHVEGLQRKAVLGFMGMMEQIHAKSYSSIFTTLATTEEIDGVFRWVEQNRCLQTKAETISQYYRSIETRKDLYLAMGASVLLESYLFYSGFFYPLYLAGQGRMTSSGEIIDLILRDESIHGLYVGVLAQELGAHVVVVGVSPRGPAAKAELRAGDLILAVDGVPVSDLPEFYTRLWAQGPAGCTIPLRMRREADVFDVEIRSADRAAMLKKPKFN